MKQTYAHHTCGKKVFAKFFINERGILVINFFMPPAGYSYWYMRGDDHIHYGSGVITADGRKFIVTYYVHPSYWLGYAFGDYKGFNSMQDVVNDIFSRMFNFNVK